MIEQVPPEYFYKSGDFFLGLDDQNAEIGVRSPRHAITIAGARSGKGACVIIPNLKRWQDNVLVIDPKGDNVQAVWEEREAMGSNVYVIDPFEVAEVPERLRASFNPLLGIDPDSLTASADLEVIADGLVKRSDPKHAQWDDGAVTLLAGIMAYVIVDAPEEHRTLKSVRDILLQDRDDLWNDATEMKKCEACDGIAQQAGAIIMTALDSEKSMEADFISAAQRHIKWINLRAMRNVLEQSSFDLSELKSGKASVFVVLPPQYLETHANFLRLFVRTALNAMAKGGSGKGERCLFFLDEFFSLGKIEMVSKSAGLMPSFGVHLWVILQDLGQLVTLYGRDESETFFGNSDVHQYFGNTDATTLTHISNRMGVNGLQDVPLPPNAPAISQGVMGGTISSMAGGAKSGANRVAGMAVGGMISAVDGAVNAAAQAEYQDQMAEYNRAMQALGKPRHTPDEIAHMVRRKEDVVANKMINIVNGSDVLILTPAPHFRSHEQTLILPPAPTKFEYQFRWKDLFGLGLWAVLGPLIPLGILFIIAYFVDQRPPRFEDLFDFYYGMMTNFPSNILAGIGGIVIGLVIEFIIEKMSKPYEDFETIKAKNSTERLIENVLSDHPDNIANKMSREELTAYYEETYRLMSLEKSKDAAQQMAIVRATYLLMVHGRDFR